MNCQTCYYRPTIRISYVIIGKPENEVEKVNKIIQATCEYLNIAFASIRTASRERKYAEARQLISIIVMETCPNISTGYLGQLLGGRDHSTVVYSRKTASNLIATNAAFKAKYKALIQPFKTRAIKHDA